MPEQAFQFPKLLLYYLSSLILYPITFSVWHFIFSFIHSFTFCNTSILSSFYYRPVIFSTPFLSSFHSFPPHFYLLLPLPLVLFIYLTHSFILFPFFCMNDVSLPCHWFPFSSCQFIFIFKLKTEFALLRLILFHELCGRWSVELPRVLGESNFIL